MVFELNLQKIIRQSNLVLKTFHRKDKFIDLEMLNKILFRFASKDNSFTYISYKNEKPSATLYFIFDNYKLYYWLSGYDSQNSHNGAGPCCIFNSIIYAKKLGISKFDLEGSILPEVKRYFRDFGGELTPYYSINKAKIPIEIALKFFYRSLF